jgi:zinc protease
MSSVKRVVLAVVLLLVAIPTLAQKKDAKSATGRFPTLKYQKYRLPNGLEVILSEDHRLPLVAVNLWYHVGAANEVVGRTGFAHLFDV